MEVFSLSIITPKFDKLFKTRIHLPPSLDILPISSIAYCQCHWVPEYELDVANPDKLLHHEVMNCRINLQSVDKALGELTMQCNALCGLYFIHGNIETERRPSIVLNKGSDRFLPRVKVTGSFYMSTRVSYFTLKGKFSFV